MKAAAEREAAAKAAVPMETLAAFHVPPSTAPWGHVQGGSEYRDWQNIAEKTQCMCLPNN